MRFLIAFAGILLSLFATVQPARAEPRHGCHDEIAAIAAAHGGSPTIAALSGASDACRRHPYFHYQTGKAHIRARRYDDARTAFDAGLADPGSYERGLKLAIGDIALHAHDYRRAAAAYRAVATAHPDWHVGFEFLGFALFALDDLDAARTALERSITLQESAEAYRTLTLVYYRQGAFDKSVDALNRGYSLDKNLLGDRDFMIAGVRAYTELERFDVARGLLAAMLKQERAIRDDPEFLRAGHYLRARMAEKGLIRE